jgi:predicted nucleotidyltransferase
MSSATPVRGYNDNEEPSAMTHHDVIAKLSHHRDDLRATYGVKSLALFGSVARGQATDSSDVDLLVEFNRPTGYFGLFALQDHLEELLGCHVDLGTRDSLKPRMRANVLRDCIDVS